MRAVFGKLWVQTFLVLLVLAGTLGFGAWTYFQGKWANDLADPGAARKQGRPIPVRTALAEEEEIEQVIGATALTAPSEIATIQIGSASGLHRTDLVVKSVHAHEGDHIKPGQALFELNDGIFQVNLKQSRAALEAADSQHAFVVKQVTYTLLTAQLEVASATAEVQFRKEDEEARKQEMDAMKDLTSNKSGSLFELLNYTSFFYQARYNHKAALWRLQKAQAALEVVDLQIKAEVAKAVSAVETARTEVAVAQRDLEQCKISSPISGIVSMFSPLSPVPSYALKGQGSIGTGFVSKGEIVPGQVVGVEVPLTQVFRLDPIHLRLDFPQERLDELSVGLKAEVILDSFPKDLFTGKVIRISPQLDPQLRVLPVVVEVSNPNNRIKAGISGYARLRLTKKAVTVPAAAVIQKEGKAMVFCVENGRARIREVKTGQPVRTGMVEIRTGIAAGDEVVFFHNFYHNSGALAEGEGYLQDNDPVDADWKKWSRRD